MKINIPTILLSFLPISIILGSSVSLINTVLFGLYFIIIYFIKSDIKIYDFKPVFLLIILNLYLVFNSLISKRVRSQDRKPFLYENSLIYFVSMEFFKKHKKIYPKRNWNFFITDKYESLDINDKVDYEIVKKISKL